MSFDSSKYSQSLLPTFSMSFLKKSNYNPHIIFIVIFIVMIIFMIIFIIAFLIIFMSVFIIIFIIVFTIIFIIIFMIIFLIVFLIIFMSIFGPLNICLYITTNEIMRCSFPTQFRFQITMKAQCPLEVQIVNYNVEIDK